MTTLLIKQKIAKGIKEIYDKNSLEAINLLVSNKVEENKFELTNEMKMELDTRKFNHKKGLTKSYTWKSIKKEILVGCIVMLLFSCKKDSQESIVDTESPSVTILKSNTWYAEKIQKISYNLNTNQFIKDTTYFTDSCTKNERIKLFNDSIATFFAQCTAPYDKNGKWYLYADSIVVYIVYNLSYGPGVLIQKGIRPSKLISINNAYFVTKETKIDGGYIYTPNPNNQKEEYFTTYKKY
jgi:hypothetical protein